jgi:hypothetical protein
MGFGLHGVDILNSQSLSYLEAAVTFQAELITKFNKM